MSSTALCQWCARIPFHKLSSARKMTWYDLGTGSRVKNSSCLLCQLMVETHYQKDTDVPNEKPITLMWREGAGVGFAFNLKTAGQDVWISLGLLESMENAAREMRAVHPRRCLVRPKTETLIDTSRVLETCFNVLLLEWQGGVAERRGLGYLMQEAVDNSLAPGPAWKEILLA